jgi:hypothetical protein
MFSVIRVHLLNAVLEGFHRLLASRTQPISVIEEKGEGFENGREIVCGCLWFAFNLGPSHCVVRLKRQQSYKNITE